MPWISTQPPPRKARPRCICRRPGALTAGHDGFPGRGMRGRGNIEIQLPRKLGRPCSCIADDFKYRAEGRMRESTQRIGRFAINQVAEGDCLTLIDELPPDSIDVLVTSPPYWGQRTSKGMGVEADPRQYLGVLVSVFSRVLPKLKPQGIVWINLGDAYNTPVNWRLDDRAYSTLGPTKSGLGPENSAYTKPRAQRRAFVDRAAPWLTYGNLLALPYRLVLGLCDAGYLYRGEVIWKKRNPMPEGRCRRPHRQHESICLLTRQENHQFRTSPPVKTVWEFSNEKIDGPAHFSRFPEELPTRCIDAYGKLGADVVVLDPFSGSGTTGMAARKLGCSYVGFEIDREQVLASNRRLGSAITIDESPSKQLPPAGCAHRRVPDGQRPAGS